MDSTTDVAIIGGGIIGASIAYHLALEGVTDVVVFEREEHLGLGSTAKCAGGVRLQFSTQANVALSQYSIAALERFEDELGQPVDFRQNGYLFLLGDETSMQIFRANAERQRELGVPVEIWTPEQARRLIPELEISDLVGATFCAQDGLANPHAIVQGYGKQAKARGVRLMKQSEVTAIDSGGGRANAVVVGEQRWSCATVVNAAGAWASHVGELAGVAVPVSPVRRQFFTTSPLEWVSDTFPMVIDWSSGVYMHKESGGMLVGRSDPDEPAGFSQHVDWDYLANVAERAIPRLPRLESAEIQSGWAGLYEVSPDHNAILGPVPELANFICANGFSGHGMQHAPAVGKALAELIVDGQSNTLDITAFAIDRFSGNSVRPEVNVI